MATYASTSSVQVQYKPETTFGTTPSAGTNYYALRVTSESMDFTVSKTQSTELNATRSISSQVATTASSSGGVQGEFSHCEYDRLLQGVMQSSFAGGTGDLGSLAIAVNTGFTSPTTMTFAVATNPGLVAGQWFRVYKVGAANHGKLLRVASGYVAGSVTTVTLDTNTPVTTEAASSGWAIQACRLSHGTTQTSFSMQRMASDLSPVEYMVYRGMTPSKFSLNIASGSLTTISFDFVGKDAVRFSGANNPLAKGIQWNSGTSVWELASGTSTEKASQAFGIHSSTTSSAGGSTCRIWAGGAPLTSTAVKSLSLEFDNALGTQEAVCNLGAVGIRSGTINCTVSAQLYFAAGAAFFDQFLANSNTELAFSSIDSDGNTYMFTLPAASVASYKVNAGGKDTDLLVDVTFTALRDTTLNKVLVIDRCGVVAV